jgi:monoterpene epsilon-lactone hydrolase
MWILYTFLLIVLFLWVLGLWFGRGEDLSVYDHPVDPEGLETFTSPDGPSREHRQAVADIQALGGQVRGMSHRERLQFTRDFMEAVPNGKEFSCEFLAVDAGGVPAEWVLAPGVDGSRRVLYIHGGAFIAGSPNSHRTISSRFSEVARAAVLAIDYRLMPENQRKDGIEDCKTAYRWMLENGPGGAAKPSRVYMSGDSAGGNLSLLMASWIRDQGLRAPDAVIALSPLVDCTYSGPSIRSNLLTDIMLGPLFGILLRIPKAILGWIFVLQNRFKPLNPIVSPVFGDLSDLPPILVQVSEAEMLLDDARRYVNKARAAGSPVRLQSWPGLLHVWQIFHPDVPEARDAMVRIGEFIAAVETGNV